MSNNLKGKHEMSLPARRDPRAEATSLLPTGHEARVVEPSPPTNRDPEWLADDPTDPSEATEQVVTPIAGEGVTWDEISLTDPELKTYANDHWLTGGRRLEALPPGYEETRRSLHQVAFFAIAPKRHQVTGKLGLRYTHRGFGTPFFGDDQQVRVEGDLLVHQHADRVEHTPVTTVSDACDFLGIEYRESWFDGFHDPLAPTDPLAPLEVDPEAASAIGDWFGFATLVLERARRTPGAAEVSRVQLWPEHFDPAVEMGSDDDGQRASYGASPGDDNHPHPYLYVAAWGEIDRAEPYWNDTTFNGASLPYAELVDSPNPAKAALDFLTTGYYRLTR